MLIERMKGIVWNKGAFNRRTCENLIGESTEILCFESVTRALVTGQLRLNSRTVRETRGKLGW